MITVIITSSLSIVEDGVRGVENCQY